METEKKFPQNYNIIITFHFPPIPLEWNLKKRKKDPISKYNRILFVDWVKTFDPWDSITDPWGLFNPPGFNTSDNEPLLGDLD